VNKDDYTMLVTSARRRQVLSTPDRPPSLFISQSPTVGEPWRNFQSPVGFGSRFQREVPLFWTNPNLPRTQPSIVRGKLVRKKSARDPCNRFGTIHDDS